MSATLIDNGIDAIIDEANRGDPTTVYLINPAAQTIRQLIETIDFDRMSPSVRLLAPAVVLKRVTEDFVLASTIADLRSREELVVRTLEYRTENALVLTPRRLIALVQTDGNVAGLATEKREFVERVNQVYSSAWKTAEAFSLRTPPLSKVKHTLATEIDPAVEQDFTTMLSSLEPLRNNGYPLDEVAISLLVAAKHEQLLYDISKWGEDVGLASKATFSRTKTRLEDQGLLDTEKVPIEVGRPRLRLKLGSEELRSSDVADLLDVATGMMS